MGPHAKKKPRYRNADISKPTPSWLARRVMKGKDPTTAVAEWDAMPRREHQWRWHSENKKNTFLAEAKAKVAEGTASVHIARFVDRGCRRAYATREDAIAAKKETKRESVHRKSQAILEFRMEHAKGCSVEGCPLAPPAEGEPPVILSLLEHDHIDRETKVGMVTALNGEARVRELAKTRCVCLWHHFLHTRKQKGYVPAGQRTGTGAAPDAKELASWKERVHCQHPLHGSMPYASLVPSVKDDPIMLGFLEVSHVFRGGAHNRDRANEAKRNMDELRSGAAVVHCSFCHALWTLAESAHMADTPFAQHQYRLLAPAFVEHFKEKTAGFDWKAERLRINRRLSEGKIAKGRAKKRKREEKEQSEEEEEGKNEESSEEEESE